MIGIIVAVEEELKAVKNLMTGIRQKTIFGNDFFEGMLGDKEVVLSLSGIGKVNAARTTQIIIDRYNVDAIINSGVAGGISNRVKIGDIVVGEKLVQHDFDLTAFGREKGMISQRVGKFIYSDIILVEKAKKELAKDDSIRGIVGTIASGDIFVTEEVMSKKINAKFEADCCEMEGAAIAQVCFLDEVPFIIIRSISDAPNDNNKVDYDNFVESASETSANFVLKILS